MGILELIQSAAPFLAPYPAWVKSLVVVWVFLTCALGLSLILASPRATTSGAAALPPSAPPSEPAPAAHAGAAVVVADRVWLLIDGVHLFGGLSSEDYVVRVLAEVNGQEFVYPSRANVRWLKIGSTMSGGEFEVPESRSGYEVSFRMTACKEDAASADGCSPADAVELVSQTVHRLRPTELGGTVREYQLHKTKGVTRAPTVDGSVKYRLSKAPNR